MYDAAGASPETLKVNDGSALEPLHVRVDEESEAICGINQSAKETIEESTNQRNSPRVKHAEEC